MCLRTPDGKSGTKRGHPLRAPYAQSGTERGYQVAALSPGSITCDSTSYLLVPTLGSSRPRP
eukprot:2600176-Rhodomonas_salina.1